MLKREWQSRSIYSPHLWGRCPAGQRGRACADFNRPVSNLKTHLPVHASGSAPWFDHARLPISPLAQRLSAGARNRATVIMTASRQPVRHRSVPRSVVFPAQLRFLCVQGPWPFGVNDPAGGWQVRSRAFARNRRDRRSRSAPGLLCLTGTPGPFSARRRTIFCQGPGMELCVVSPHQAPVPPRRIAMRCSRGGTGVIFAQVWSRWRN
jgi:hypothetical protein